MCQKLYSVIRLLHSIDVQRNISVYRFLHNLITSIQIVHDNTRRIHKGTAHKFWAKKVAQD